MRTWGFGVLSLVLAFASACSDPSARTAVQRGASPAAAHSGAEDLPATSTTVTTERSRLDAGELHFLDSRIGWVPVTRSCGEQTCIVVFATGDGGQTWTPKTDPPVSVRAAPNDDVLGAPLVRLATVDLGWLIDPTGNLYSTQDGAKTWRAEQSDHPVVALEARGDTVWRLDQSCPPSSARCRYTVVASHDRGRHWAAIDPQPPIGRSGVSSLRPGLAVPSPDVAYVFSDAGDYPAALHSGDPAPEHWKPDPLLARTSDGGRTWATAKPPCPADDEGGSWGADLAGSTADDLWLVCSDEAGSGAMQPKHLHRSSDGGRTWSPDLGTPNAGSGGRTAAGSPLRACRGGSRTSISCTRDGGHTWFWPIPNGADNPRDGGIGVFQFLGERHAWAIGQDLESGNVNVLWRTTDGGETWSPSQIAP